MKRGLGALLLAAPALAAAQAVSLAGQMGSKALLVIDGQPQTLAVGEAARGVRLLRLDDDGAMVEAGGRRLVLRADGTPARLAGTPGPAAGAREVVITAGSGGHFVVGGAINGRAVRFLVDTGATLISISQAEADRLGLSYRDGERASSQTANGVVPMYLVTLGSVRIGEVELANVPAAVIPAPMPGILLGNSALSRFQMRRENDVMRLTVR